jgi:hypothetical protein
MEGDELGEAREGAEMVRDAGTTTDEVVRRRGEGDG